MAKLLTSKQVMEHAGISRATLNNYIALGILPKPVLQKPESDGVRAPRIGCFPASVLETIERIHELKGQGCTMARIAEELKADDDAASGSPEYETPERGRCVEAADSSHLDTPRLTCDHITYPSYLLNYRFELEWYNSPAAEQIFDNKLQLSSRIEDRNIFQLLFDSAVARQADGFEDVLRFHLGLAKGKLTKPALLMKHLNIDHACLARLMRAYDAVEAVDIKPVVCAESGFSPLAGSSSHFTRMFASFFREGILITYLPAASDADSLLAFLAGRDQVIGSLLRKRRPYLTHVAVLVADLQDSCNICAELPPEEYFELINAIWGGMETIKRKYNAVSGKHAGDGAVYYFFPRPEENYVFNAIQCAREMKAMMLQISREWKNRKNWVNDLRLNIGIDQGEEWFGTYQTATQLEFTVLGCTVNHAGRLSDFAQEGAVWATKKVLGKLATAERETVRFGIRRKVRDGYVQIPASYSRVSSLVDMENPKYEKMRDIGGIPVTEIFDVAA